MYHAVGADLGAKVYRQAIKIALNAIFTLKLKTFWFSTGGEEIRHSLYERLATRFETKYGYYCYRNGVVFKFYKIVD